MPSSGVPISEELKGEGLGSVRSSLAEPEITGVTNGQILSEVGCSEGCR